jgi:hypothetical protein
MTRVRDDDDDEPAPSRGRPRSPEQYGPRKPEPHERNECFERLDALLHSLEIGDIGRNERLYLQHVMCRAERLRRLDAKRFANDGDARVILILRSIAETANGTEALILPVMQAVACCMHEAWTDRGLEWLEALDKVPLLEIQSTLQSVGLERHLPEAIRYRLTQILGAPVVAKPEPKKPAKKTARSACVPESAWNNYAVLRKKLKRPRIAA